MRQYMRFAAVGTQFGLTITLFVLGGYWLDQKTGQSPLFTVLGVFLGFGVGMASLISQVLGEPKK